VPLFLQRPEPLAPFHRGDERVLEEVYWAYCQRVEAVARHGSILLRSGGRVRGIDDVEDLVNETFARAFTDRARKSYDGKRPYGPYLAAIARNLLVDEARRRGRELATGELPEELPVEVPEAPEWADPDTVRVVEAYLSELLENVQLTGRKDRRALDRAAGARSVFAADHVEPVADDSDRGRAVRHVHGSNADEIDGDAASVDGGALHLRQRGMCTSWEAST
jgi:DNA-directed RNA polymerase specialized sigma24 family protein